MNNWPLQQRLLAISLIPLFLVTIVLSFFYLSNSVNSLREQTHEQGQLLASQLAPAVEYGVISGNRKSLDRIIYNLLEHESVVRVELFDDNKKSIATAIKERNHKSFSENVFDNLFEWLSGINTTNTFQADITSEPVDLDDYAYEINLNTTEEIIGHVSVDVSVSTSAYKQLKGVITGLFVAFVIFISVFFYSIKTSRQITKTINHLADTVSQIQEGELNSRSHIAAGAELQQLSHGINAMAENIARSEEKLKFEVQQATSKLIGKNEALEEAERDAVAASEAKSVFLANMSHEIRTPMNGIMGFIEVLLRTPLDNQQKNYAQTIRSASENLLLLINDILDFSRIESGKMPIEKVSVEFNSLISELFSLHSQAAFNKNIELLFYADSDIPRTCELDPKLFKQIMMNLISNAIKFTERGYVSVIFRYSHTAQKITVQVKDTGIGLPEHRISGIFNEFEQGDNSTARHYGGSGLGLAITSRIIKLVGGDIKAYNHDDGACFEFQIPMGEIAPSPQDRQGPNIALIGDDRRAIESYSSLIKRYGYNVYTPQIKDIVHTHYQAILYLLSAQDLHYRIPPPKEAIAFVSSNDPDDLATVKSWGFKQAAHKTIDESTLEEILFSAKDYHNSPNKSATAPLTLKTNNRNMTLSGLHVLVVDDNHVNLTLMDTYLSELGAEVLMCDNGERAIQVIQSNHVDIVFLDVHMPGMDGFQTTKSIRQQGYSPQMFPVVGVSADGVGDIREKALTSGMDEYILKPVSQKQLVDVIYRFLPKAINSIDNETATNTSSSSSEAILMDELTSILIQQLPDMINDLKQAFSAFDNQSLFQIAHKLHGACIYCDMPKVQAASKALEDTCRSENNLAIQTHYEQLLAEIEYFYQANLENAV